MSTRSWLLLSVLTIMLGIFLAGWSVNKLGGFRYLAHRLHTNDAWPTYSQRESQLQLLPARKVSLLLLGDSHVAFGEWAEWLPGIRLANRGIPGADLLGLPAFAKTLPLTSAKYIVVEVGTNDLLFRDVAQVTKDYQKLIDLLRLAHDGEAVPQIILCTTPGVNNDVRWTGIAEADVADLNAAILTLGIENSITVLDLADVLGTQNGLLPPELTDDGVHLRGEGYKIWRDLLKENLKL